MNFSVDNIRPVISAEKIGYFMTKIMEMPDDIADPFEFMDPGVQRPFWTGMKTILLPGVGSEFAQFRDLVWCGSHESADDIILGKAKKLKFLNDIKNVKNKFLALMDFIAVNGDRNVYWSQGLNPEQDWVIDGSS